MTETDDIFDKEISCDSDCTNEDEYEVEKIVADDWNAEKQKRSYLVKWVGYPSSQNSWEPEENLRCSSLLEAYKAEKNRKIRKSCDRDSGDENFLVPDYESPAVEFSSKSSNKQHRHEKSRKSSKYTDQSTSKNTLDRLIKQMKNDNKSPRSSYSLTSKTKHKKQRTRNEKDSSSISSSNNSSRDTSLRPNSESGYSVSSSNAEQKKRKRLMTVDEEDRKVDSPKKSALKRASRPSFDSDSSNDDEKNKISLPEYSKEQLGNENKTTSISPNSSTSTSFADLFQKYKKKRSVEEAIKIKKQKSKEEEKLEAEKRFEKSKEDALQEYLTSQSETDNEVDSCSNSKNKLKETDEFLQKRTVNSDVGSSLSDNEGDEENYCVNPTTVVSNDDEKGVKKVEKMRDNINTSPDQLISEHDGIDEEEIENDTIFESNNEKDYTEQEEKIEGYLIDSVNEKELVEGLEQIDRLFDYKIDNTTTTEEQMRPFIDGSDDDIIYSGGESRDIDQMDSQTPSPGVGELADDEQIFVQNTTYTTNGVNRPTIPSTASSDFYKRLFDGSIDDLENEPELTDEILANISLEELDPPDYEPMEPISVVGPTNNKVRIFNLPDQKNGFDRGWKVESVLGIAANSDNMCFVKFIGYRTPQKLPYELVRKHALQDYFMYHEWIASKINPTMRGAYWDKKLNNPSSWMTAKALASFKEWKEEVSRKND